MYSIGLHRGFGEIYLITNLMESSLFHTIKSNQALADDQIKRILYQLLRGLLYLHSGNVTHGDLRPHHVLVSKDYDEVQIW